MTAVAPGNEILQRTLRRLHARTSQLFFWLLLTQWVLAVTLALALSPFSWAGNTRSLHPHIQLAILMGGAINALPLLLLKLRPEWWLTRHVVAAAQMLWSALLIHITGGRIETHFHIFGSLAFLAIYRDWRVLVTATLVIAGDHVVRGLFWPESVYGLANPEWWRFFEHAGWLFFEDAVLVLNCSRVLEEMGVAADREASLEQLNQEFEFKVADRTADLTMINQLMEYEMNARLTMEADLRQAQKLESVGRLAAGVAHEINTPVQFVSDSVLFLKDAAKEIFAELEKRPGEPNEDSDLPYLVENVPKAIDRAIEGLNRVAVIVRSLKEFAHPDRKEKTLVDLNKAIESTLTIARNEYKYVADLHTELGEIPHVLCHPGELNQVVLNVVVNAAHAIADTITEQNPKGRIEVRTRREGDDVIISIGDSGGGIPEAVRDRIFDPFFTTKEVGKGTGQGLAIARNVIVDKHGGQLTFETELGKGTTFFIRLPIGEALEKVAA
jgi:signal transduction histidine kinase